MSCRRRRSDGQRGFTLIEALVALAIIAAVLGAIGTAIGTSVQGTRAIDQKLALSGAAESVMASLPARNALKVGSQSGAIAGHRWRIDVTPIKAAADDATPPRFVPLSVTMRMQGPGGAQIQVTTVRLVPRPPQ